METAPSAIPVARESPWLPTATRRRLAARDLGQQTAERVALDQFRLESVERFGLDAATLERRLRLFGQVSEHLGHRPAGMHGDGRIVDCEERERSVGRGDHAAARAALTPASERSTPQTTRSKTDVWVAVCTSQPPSASAAAMSSVESTPTGRRVGPSTTRRWAVPCSVISCAARSSVSAGVTMTIGLAAEPPAV